MEQNALCMSNPAPMKQQCECSQDNFTKMGCQFMDISVPIQLKPEAALDKVEIECCDKPTVNCCNNCCNNTIEVVVTQKLRVKFPIHYTVTACMGESTLDCIDCEEAIKG